MEENKDKLVFSSIRSEKVVQETSPKEAVDKAFHEEYIRQTQEIPVAKIKQALEAQNNQNEQIRLINPQPQVKQQPSTVVQQQTPQVSQVNPQASIPQTPVQQKAVQQMSVTQTPVQPSPQQLSQSTISQNQPLKPPVKKESQEQPKIKEKHHMKKSVKNTIIILIIVLTTIFSTYRIISYFNIPRVITKKALVNLSTEIKNIINPNNQATIIGDDYNIASTITTNLDSQVFKEDSNNNTEMLENLYLMNNLNSSKTILSITHNSKDKKFFYNRQTIKNDKIIINDKFLIDNSTEYYFVQDFFENYINDGNNTYFETINDDINAIDNITYLYKKIIESIPNSIDEEYFNQTNTTTYLNNKTENVHKLSLKLDNIKLRKIANNVLRDLKKDKRAFNILNSVIDDFTNYKITSKTKFIETDETLNINIYTQGTLNKIKKYEVVKIGHKKSIGITYEVDDNKITILKDNKVKYYLKYKINSTNVKVDISNKSEKKIGSISFDNTDTRKHLTVEIEDEEYNTSIDLNYKISDKKKSSYKSTTKAIINIKKENRNYLSGTISMESKVSNKVTINEEVKEVTFSSEVTEEKKEELNNLFKTRLKKQIN